MIKTALCSSIFGYFDLNRVYPLITCLLRIVWKKNGAKKPKNLLHNTLEYKGVRITKRNNESQYVSFTRYFPANCGHYGKPTWPFHRVGIRV